MAARCSGLPNHPERDVPIEGLPRFERNRMEATHAMIFSADETTDIGDDFGMPVSSGYTAESSKFSGKIELVQIDVGEDSHDHLVDPRELIRVAMSRQ